MYREINLLSKKKCYVTVRSWLTETMRAQDVCRIMIEQTIIKCGCTYDDYRNDLPKNMVVHVNRKNDGRRFMPSRLEYGD